MSDKRLAIRKKLLSSSLKALAMLREERDRAESEGEDISKDWCERFRLIADQIRRDLPDVFQELPVPEVSVSDKPKEAKFSGFKLVGN
jgi:hypothetical protein